MQNRIPRPKTGNKGNTDTEQTNLPVAPNVQDALNKAKKVLLAPNVQDTLNKAKKVLQEEQKVKEKKVYSSCGC